MRKRYTFDDDVFVECGRGYSFYPHPSGNFFFLVGGNNNGCRVLVEFSAHDGVAVGIGAGLHAQETVKCTDALAHSVRKALRWAADSGSGETPLLDIWQVPGFEESRVIPNLQPPNLQPPPRGTIRPLPEPVAVGTHHNGWFTRSRFSIAITPPAWAPDAQAFDLREGVYIAFTDSTFRLVPKRQYFHPIYGDNLVPVKGLHYQHGRVPAARQGDLLLYDEADFSEPIAETATEQSYDRHLVNGYQVAERPDVWSCPTITHPEHARLEMKGVYRLVFALGTSRPFARANWKELD